MAQNACPTEDWYRRSLERMELFMTAVGVMALVSALVIFGWRIAVGFALGSLIAYVNFHWLEKAVARLAEVTVESGIPASGRGIMHRFLLHYVLLAVVAFVILRVSRASLYGLFAGLFLPVAAMLCEAVYESYKAISD